MINKSVKQILEIIDIAEPDSDVQVSNLVASEDVWLELLDLRPDVRRNATLNKHLPAAVLARLAVDDDPNVRFGIAMKRRLSADLFSILAADGDESVRHRIALNPKVPHEVLRMLANDPSEFVSSAARLRLARL